MTINNTMLSSQDITLASSTLSLSPIRNNPLLYAKIETKALELLNCIKSSFHPKGYWLHITIPCFFEAIEERNNSSLIKKEYIIESSNQVKGYNRFKCSNLYLNQSFKDAKALYENAVIIKCNYQLYLEDTKQLTKMLMGYDKNIKRVDWSEFYLDLATFIEDNYASSSIEEIYDIVKEIRDKIIAEMTGIKECKSSSTKAPSNHIRLGLGIGLGANKVIARLSSIKSIKKDNKIILIPNDIKEIEAFISDITISSIPFISERTKAQLNDLGIITCKDILTKYVELYYVFEKKYTSLISIALGIGPDEHEEIKETKPISFQESITDQKDIKRVFNSLVKSISNEMKESKYKGKTLTLEVVDECKKKTKRSLTLAKRFETEKEIRVNGEKMLNDLIEKVNKISQLRVRLSTLTKDNDGSNDIVMNEWLRHKQSNKNINVIKFSNSNSNSNNSNSLSKGLYNFATKTSSFDKDSKRRSKSSELNLFKNVNNTQKVKLKTPKRRSKQKKMKSKFTLDTFLITK